MGATFVVTLREAFEASLILGIVYTYLEKIGARDSYRYVTWGGALGLMLSVGMGIGVGYLSGPLLDFGPDLVGLVVIFGAVALLTWHAWWMQQHARLVKSDVQHRIDEARASRATHGGCALAAAEDEDDASDPEGLVDPLRIDDDNRLHVDLTP